MKLECWPKIEHIEKRLLRLERAVSSIFGILIGVFLAQIITEIIKFLNS